MSQYQYIADAWNNETDEVQTRWYLQDKCQKDTWERDCAEAELKGSVPFLEANPAVLRSPSTFSLQASSEHPVHADEVRVLASHGVASSPTIEDLKRTSSPRDILHTVTQ
ncbi:unnamed protein product [Peniophora sp. CBMAI 1063]|nr:unnamed protein product [Peniophora sp. CBMAI 1063]